MEEAVRDRVWARELARRHVEHVVAAETGAPARHRLEVDSLIAAVEAEHEVLAEILAVGGAERALGASEPVSVGEDDLAERAGRPKLARPRPRGGVAVPGVADGVVRQRVVHEPRRLGALLGGDGDGVVRVRHRRLEGSPP